MIERLIERITRRFQEFALRCGEVLTLLGL